MNTQRLMTVSAVALLVALMWVTLVFNQKKYPPPVELQISDQPSIGYSEAKAHVVVFEDPLDPKCIMFNQESFPLINRQYIETGKIKYTSIPISIVSNSIQVTNALWCLYHLDPVVPNAKFYFHFLEAFYHAQDPSSPRAPNSEELIGFAKTLSADEKSRLTVCIDSAAAKETILANTNYARKLEKATINAPVLYVNGIHLPDPNLGSLNRLIDRFVVGGE